MNGKLGQDASRRSFSFNGNGTTTLVSGSAVPGLPKNATVEVSVYTASQSIASASASELGTTMNQRPLAAIPLTCPVSVPSCSSSSSSSSPGYQRLDTANASKPNTVKGIEIVVETCAAAGAVPCNVLDAALKLGSGDIEQLPYALPGLSLIKKAKTGAGLSFEAYKATRGGTETLRMIETTNAAGTVVLQRISTEFSHMFITQRMQRRYNLPNWLVNNRVNVWKLNTVQHERV